VPGDDTRADRGCDGRQDRHADGSEGERDRRAADPGGHGLGDEPAARDRCRPRSADAEYGDNAADHRGSGGVATYQPIGTMAVALRGGGLIFFVRALANLAIMVVV